MPSFETYFGGQPSLTTPEATDTVLVLHNGVVYQVPALTLSPTTPLAIDCTTGSQSVDIKNYTDVIIFKTDGTVNSVIISDSSGRTIEGLAFYRDGLKNQYESVHLLLDDNNWVEV